MITLQFKEIRKEFANTDELREFAQLQSDSWSWLQEIGTRDRYLNRFRRIYDKYLNQIDNFLNQYEQHKDQQDSIKKRIAESDPAGNKRRFPYKRKSSSKICRRIKGKNRPLGSCLCANVLDRTRYKSRYRCNSIHSRRCLLGIAVFAGQYRYRQSAARCLRINGKEIGMLSLENTMMI